MTVLSGRQQKKVFPGGPWMNVGQRLLLVGIPKRARALLERLENQAEAEPEYWDPFIESTREFCSGDSASFTFTFGLFHNPSRTVAGVVVAVATPGLLVLDANDGHRHAGFEWQRLCRFDVKHERSYQVVGLSWYDGEQDIATRLEDQTPLQPHEMSGGYMYLHAHPTVLGAVATALGELGVPKRMHRTPPLL